MKALPAIIGLLALLCIVVAIASSAGKSAAPDPSAQALPAVRDYRLCERGHTLDTAVTMAMTAATAQERYASRVDGTEGSDNIKVAYEYKARNGARQKIVFGWHPSTGSVGAENDAAVAVLDLMRASCRG